MNICAAHSHPARSAESATLLSLTLAQVTLLGPGVIDFSSFYSPESLQNLKEMSQSYLCIYSVSSVAQWCPTLCDPMNRSTPGLPVHHQPLEFTQTHVHRVSDAIQPSHPLLSPSPPAFNLY